VTIVVFVLVIEVMLVEVEIATFVTKFVDVVIVETMTVVEVEATAPIAGPKRNMVERAVVGPPIAVLSGNSGSEPTIQPTVGDIM
jgi:hypothetical protein